MAGPVAGMGKEAVVDHFFPKRPYYGIANLLSFWGAHRLYREIKEKISEKKITIDALCDRKFFPALLRIIFVFCTVLALLSHVSRLCAGELHTHYIHYGVETILLTIPISIAVLREGIHLVKSAKKKLTEKLKIERGMGQGLAFGMRGIKRLYHAEISLLFFKLVVLSGFFVAGGLAIGQQISLKQLGTMGLALGGGYCLGSLALRYAIDRTELHYHSQLLSLKS